MLKSDALALTWRRQELRRDSKHRNSWVEASACEAVEPANVGLIICDVWDNHWSRGARERLEALVPRIDGVISAARSRGVLIVHAPSDTMDFYADAPARKRIRSVEKLTPPVVRSVPDMPLPIDDSDGGSDTQEASREANWTRQHPGIRIDQDTDVISDDGAEIYSFFRHRGINLVMLAGVHTNMCILNRSFGIRQMLRWGMRVMLLRDLTDASYNPARPPYVAHDVGTQLVIGYIERFLCPTIHSRDLWNGEEN